MSVYEWVDLDQLAWVVDRPSEVELNEKDRMVRTGQILTTRLLSILRGGS